MKLVLESLQDAQSKGAVFSLLTSIYVYIYICVGYDIYIYMWHLCVCVFGESKLFTQ